MTAGFAIADAYVEVRPETGGFAAELTRALAGLEPVDIKVRVDADTVRDEVRRAGEQGGRQGEQAGRDIGGKLSSGLKLGLAGAGAVVALSLKDAFSSATTGSAMLQAAFGQTAEQAEASSGIAAAVFRDNFGGSMSDAQAAVGQVTQAMGGFGKASDEQIRLATESALTLTDVFGIEMPETMRAASNLVKTGVAPDMTAAMDVITSGFQSGANKSDDFLDTLNEYAGPFARLGLNGSQALALINQGLAAGARDSDVVADSLKEFSIRAIDGSAATGAAFAAAGLNAADMAARIAAGGPTAAAAFQQTLVAVNAITDPVQRNAALVGLFGTQAEDLGPKVFAAFDLSAKGVESVAGSTAKAGEAIYTTPQAKVSALVRTIKADLLDFLGDTVVPAVVGLGSKLAGPFETVKSAVQAVAPPFSALAVLVGNHTTTLGALATAVSVLVGAWVAYRTGVAVVSAVTKAWTAVQAAFNVVMALNPFVLIIVGLAALAAGLYYAYTHSETFRRIVTAALQGTWAVIKIVGGAFADFGHATAGVFVAIGNGVSGFVMFFVRIWRGGFDLVYSITHGAITAVQGAIEIPLAFLKLAFTLWFTAVTTIFKIGFAVVEGIVKFFIALFTGDWTGAWNAIRDTTTKILGIVSDAIDKGLGAIKGFFTGAVSGIKTIWDGLKEVAAAPVRFVVNTVYNDGIRKAWNFVASKVGLPELATLTVQGLAAGGPVTGGTPGRDSVLRLLMPNEHVLTADEVAAMGGHGAVFALRRAFGGGTQARGPAMGFGGLVSSAWDATGGAAVAALSDAALGALADGLELVFKPLRAAMDAAMGRDEDWSGGANRLMQKPMDGLVAKVRGEETETVAASGGGGGGGDVERWRGVALQALAYAGQPASWIDLLLKRMNQESGGDPTVVNKWDSNWAAGTPSVGLLQLIGPTFRSHAGPFSNVGPQLYGVSTNPFANIYASIKYTQARYGTLGAWSRPGGYAAGGEPPLGEPFWVGEEGRELMVLGGRTRATVTPEAKAGGVTNHYHLDRSMSTPEVVAEMQRRLALAVA